MVAPQDVPRVVRDAAGLVKTGEIVVFGSAALAFSLPDAPASRDVDLWVEPKERGDAVTALMGELSWYHERHGAYVEVWAPETFAAPEDWRSRARNLSVPEEPGVKIVIAHPHDVLMSKIERMDPGDRDHIGRILAAHPIGTEAFDQLVARMPHRLGRIADAGRVAAFDANVPTVRALVSAPAL